MELTSPDFKHSELIPSRFTCDGEDINPTLEIRGVPDEAAGLVLIVDDPDAPSGRWVHWTVWNIDPKTERIIGGSAPVGSVEGMTDFNRTGYGGPCPPSGTHRYFFKLYAIDITLNLDSGARAGDLLDAISDHMLEQTELIGLYAKSEE